MVVELDDNTPPLSPSQTEARAAARPTEIHVKLKLVAMPIPEVLITFKVFAPACALDKAVFAGEEKT